MIPNGHQTINSVDIKAVTRVLKSDWLTQGPKVLEFEKALAEYCGAKYAVAVCNGTAALHLAYLAAGLKKGDEVITTANTFAATANMVLTCGARPVFCDIRKDTYNIDETKIEKLITKKTRAIVPVHFAGHPCEMDNILRIAKKYRLLVIEDACHALGAKYKNKKIGGLQSDMSVFSFHPVKSITTGEGGAILTNDKIYYEKLKLLRSHGVVKDKNGFNVMKELGYNYRLTDIQASLGLTQLKRLDKFLKIRHQLVKLYDGEFKNIREIIPPIELHGDYSSWHLYVIRVKDSKYRLPLFNFLIKNGVAVNMHYPTVYLHPFYKKNYLNRNLCLQAEQYARDAITLPIHVSLTVNNIKFITNIIKRFFIKI